MKSNADNNINLYMNCPFNTEKYEEIKMTVSEVITREEPAPVLAYKGSWTNLIKKNFEQLLKRMHQLWKPNTYIYDNNTENEAKFCNITDELSFIVENPKKEEFGVVNSLQTLEKEFSANLNAIKFNRPSFFSVLEYYKNVFITKIKESSDQDSPVLFSQVMKCDIKPAPRNKDISSLFTFDRSPRTIGGTKRKGCTNIKTQNVFKLNKRALNKNKNKNIFMNVMQNDEDGNLNTYEITNNLPKVLFNSQFFNRLYRWFHLPKDDLEKQIIVKAI